MPRDFFFCEDFFFCHHCSYYSDEVCQTLLAGTKNFMAKTIIQLAEYFLCDSKHLVGMYLNKYEMDTVLSPFMASSYPSMAK